MSDGSATSSPGHADVDPAPDGCGAKRGTVFTLIVLARPWQWIKNGFQALNGAYPKWGDVEAATGVPCDLGQDYTRQPSRLGSGHLGESHDFRAW